MGVLFSTDENMTLWNKDDGMIDFGKCRFGSSAFYGGNIEENHDNSLFFLSQQIGNYSLSDQPLFNSLKDTNSNMKTYIDTKDNSMICTRWTKSKPTIPGERSSGIPIFWSGSSSFQVFLKVEFYEDRFVVDAITAEKDVEGEKYTESHNLPNIIYPFHMKSDLEKVTIFRS